MNKSTMIDNVHRAIDEMMVKMKSCWEKAIKSARYLMVDELQVWLDVVRMAREVTSKNTFGL